MDSLTALPYFLYNSGLFRIHAHGKEQGEPAPRLEAHTDKQEEHIGLSNFWIDHEDVFRKAHEVTREWYVIDATDKVLGRVASEVARRLRGKHKPEFTRTSTLVISSSSSTQSKLKVTGNKTLDKKYYRHSGYPGGIYETTFGKMQERFRAARSRKRSRACCRRPLGYAMIKKLKVYAEATHPHSAQQPKALEI